MSREVDRHGGREDYRACAAQRAAKEALRRPKDRKLATSDRLRAEVEARLEVKHSPEQIANRLVEDFPDDLDMRISHETIYTELYLQGRGSLREELTEALRTGRAKRRPKGPNPGRGKRGKLGDRDRSDGQRADRGAGLSPVPGATLGSLCPTGKACSQPGW